MDEKCLSFSSDFHAFSSCLCRLERDAGDPHCQFNAVDGNVCLIVIGLRQFNGSFLQSPVPQGQPSGLPPQSLDAITSSIDEKIY